MQIPACRLGRGVAPGHAGINLRADLELADAQRLHTGARGFPACHHQALHPEGHQTLGDAGQGLFHQATRGSCAQPALHLGHCICWCAGVNQHRALRQARRSPGQHLLHQASLVVVQSQGVELEGR